MSVDISKKLIKIEDIEQYQALIESSQKKLVMIDFYQVILCLCYFVIIIQLFYRNGVVPAKLFNLH